MPDRHSGAAIRPAVDGGGERARGSRIEHHGRPAAQRPVAREPSLEPVSQGSTARCVCGGRWSGGGDGSSSHPCHVMPMPSSLLNTLDLAPMAGRRGCRAGIRDPSHDADAYPPDPTMPACCSCLVSCDGGGQVRDEGGGPSFHPPSPLCSLARVTRWVLADLTDCVSTRAACCLLLRQNKPTCISSLHWGPFLSQNRTPEARSISSPHPSRATTRSMTACAVLTTYPVGLVRTGLVPNWPSLFESDTGWPLADDCR